MLGRHRRHPGLTRGRLRRDLFLTWPPFIPYIPATINKLSKDALAMLLKLFLAFTLIPVIELALLIRLGGVIGVINTLLLVIATGFCGAWLARAQGFRTMLRVRERLGRGAMPAEDLIDAVIIFAAGVVLLTPGLVTDIAGLLLLLPATRTPFKRWLRGRFDRWMHNPNSRISRFP